MLFLFEIEVIPAYAPYALFLPLGAVGFGLGLLRWRLGAIWFIGLLLLGSAFWWVQYDDVSFFYEYVIRDYGYATIAHLVLGPLTAMFINLVGIWLGFHRRNPSPWGNDYADTENVGRV